jgi:hypothetical protein
MATKQKSDGKSRRLSGYLAIDLSGSGFNHPVTHSEALADLAALAAGLLGFRRSRRNGA